MAQLKKVKTIILNGNSVSFDIVYSNRRSISIKIDKNGNFCILSPIGINDKYIDDLIQKHKHWILNRIADRKEKQEFAYTNKYKDGGWAYFLGQKLSITAVLSNSNTIEREDNSLIINYTEQKNIESLVYSWYARVATAEFTRICDHVREMFCDENGVRVKNIQLKKLKSAWGRCTSLCNISLNIELIRYRDEMIRYVMIHELCHLVHMDHSANFYALQAQYVKNWKQLKQELKTTSCL